MSRRPLRYAPLGRAPGLNKHWKRGGNQQGIVLSTGLGSETDSAIALARLKAVALGRADEFDASFTLFTPPIDTAMQADWVARSTASGVFYAEQLADASKLVLAQAAGGSNPNGLIWTFPANWSFDTTIKRSGVGSYKNTVLASSGSDPGELRLPIGQLRGNGTDTYYQFSIYLHEDFLRYKPTYSGGGAGGWKQMIVSHTSGSNQNNEVVTQDTNRRGFPQWYHQNGVQFVDPSASVSTPCNASNFRFSSNVVDRGAPASPATCDEYISRFGLIYSNPNYPNGGGTNNSAPQGSDVHDEGYPYPIAMIAHQTWRPNAWNTILLRVTIGTLGTASSTVEMWFCRPGEAYTKLFSHTNVQLGTANSGHNAIWLQVYETNRNPNTVPVTTHINFAEVIASSEFINAPAVADTTRKPAWRAVMSPNTWVEVGTNTLSSIDPEDDPAVNPNHPSAAPWHGSEGQPGSLDDWCSMTFDDETQTAFVANGGGHGGYLGNEVNRLRMGTGSPAWQMIRKPTGAIGNTGNLSDGQDSSGVYFDGAPRPVHHYGYYNYVRGVGPIMPMLVAPGASIGRALKAFIYNPISGTYRLWKDWSGTSNVGSLTPGASCYDPSRQCIWMLHCGFGQLKKLDLGTGAVTGHGTVDNHVGSNNKLIYIPGQDLIAVISDGESGYVDAGIGFSIIRLDTFAHTARSFTGSFASGFSLAGSVGADWDSVRNRIVLWNNTTNRTQLSTLTPGANYITSAWTAGSVTVSGSNAVTPSTRNTTGTYGKMVYSASLDGVLLLNRVSEKLYFYALS